MLYSDVKLRSDNFSIKRIWMNEFIDLTTILIDSVLCTREDWRPLYSAALIKQHLYTIISVANYAVRIAPPTHM